MEHEAADDRRTLWEQRWNRRQGAEFDWHQEHLPPELVELLANRRLPPGPALDLGCGDGVMSRQLHEHFVPVVGVDIAYAAVARGHQARSAGAGPCYAVMDASHPAFRSATFSFVFDRGCLQNLPEPAWPAYFREIERVLAPGGVLQLFCCKAARETPASGGRGLLARLAGGRRPQGGPQFATSEYIRRLLPPSLTVLAQSDRAQRLKSGSLRSELYGLFEKSVASA